MKFISIINLLPKLLKAMMRGLPSLKVLHIIQCPAVTFVEVETAIKYSRSLESLAIDYETNEEEENTILNTSMYWRMVNAR